jgi:hypothetical protein
LCKRKGQTTSRDSFSELWRHEKSSLCTSNAHTIR